MSVHECEDTVSVLSVNMFDVKNIRFSVCRTVQYDSSYMIRDTEPYLLFVT